MHWNVTLSRKEFDDAKAGNYVIVGAFPKGKNLGFLIIGNRELTHDEIKREFHGILANGDDVYYVCISDWSWEQLNNPELNRVPYIKFSDGVGFVFISDGAAERLKKEIDEGGEN